MNKVDRQLMLLFVLFRNEREEVPEEYIHVAVHLKLPFDNVRRVHDQFDGYSSCKSF